ncbi:MAG: permease [Patescibacteria group bacterium]
MLDSETVKNAFFKTLKSFGQFMPIVLGSIMLVSILITIIPKDLYTKVFTGNELIDSLLGSAIGSIAMGNPIVSYIIGGKLLEQGVALVAVTAFIIAWISVGITQLPAESIVLGKRFAFIRNFLCFLTALVVAILTVFTSSLI